MLRRFLTQELEYEKKLLDKLRSKKIPHYDSILIHSGSGSFYIRKRGNKKAIFVPRSNTKLLSMLSSSRFYLQKIRILENNIVSLEKALLKINDYNDENVLAAMPKVYSEAFQVARKRENHKTVIQSENPYNRNELESKSDIEKYVIALNDIEHCKIRESNEYTKEVNDFKPMEKFVFTYIVTIPTEQL